MTVLLDGKTLSNQLLEQLSNEVKEFEIISGIKPHLSVILVGNDPASQIYVTKKQSTCKKYGFSAELVTLPKETTQIELLNLINRMNGNDQIHGILVQQPLPNQIDADIVSQSIDPKKDVDGFHPENMGLLMIGNPRFVACTPLGIINILDHYHIQTAGKHVVVIGRSNIVGKPIASLLMQKSNPGNSTVTVVHSQSENIISIIKQADILIAAIGQPEFVKSDWVKEGAVIIDVGINRIEDKSSPKGYRIVGDVSFNETKDKCSAITPVPGGVGPMTIAMLLKNTLISAKNRFEK